MKFQVGQKVQWAGVNGVVIKDWKFQSEDAASIEVEFEARVSSIVPPQQYQRCKFLRDGRLHPWHKEASLKVIS